jgi:hypothetical protein
MSLSARQLLQELCKADIGWDSPLSEVYEKRWKQWLDDVRSIEGLRVPRWVGLSRSTLMKVELHMFSDASDTGYGVVGYLRLVDQGVSCGFVMGKSRVAPRKVITLPRMELVAATLSSKLMKHIVKEIQIPLTGVILWTDSTIVLHYLSNTTSRFATFVANRVRLIRENTKGCRWRHVPTELNPADVGSRGLRSATSPRMNLWLEGPSFLLEDEGCWPVDHFDPPSNPQELEEKTIMVVV